jgi:hypothetical protein
MDALQGGTGFASNLLRRAETIQAGCLFIRNVYVYQILNMYCESRLGSL